MTLKIVLTKTSKQQTLFNQVFNENRVIVMLKSAAGGRAGVRQLLVSVQ